MADEEKVTTEEQALADEWAAALAEAGDASQDDIDALMAQGGATPVAEPSTPRAPMEEFGASPKAPTISGLEGPNLDVILDIPVTISMEVGHTDISIRNLLQLNQGSVIELDRLAGEPLDVLVNGTLIAHGEVVVVNEKFGIRLTLTPTVMNNRRIALKVAPEVSELDYSAGIQSGGVAVPALRVRRTDTSVMLADGESFVISGLTSSNSVSNVDKFPWLGDIPILGAFFRSTKLDKDDRELLMIVTPHLVQPLAADAQLPDLPGEGLRHYDPGFSRLYFLERGEYDGQQNDTGLSD